MDNKAAIRNEKACLSHILGDPDSILGLPGNFFTTREAFFLYEALIELYRRNEPFTDGNILAKGVRKGFLDEVKDAPANGVSWAAAKAALKDNYAKDRIKRLSCKEDAMSHQYDSKAICGLLENMGAAQDLMQVLHFGTESQKQIAAVPGIAIALEKLTDPVVKFLEWAGNTFPDGIKQETVVAYVDKETGKKMGGMRVISV
jgi:hypothetical protein